MRRFYNVEVNIPSVSEECLESEQFIALIGIKTSAVGIPILNKSHYFSTPSKVSGIRCRSCIEAQPPLSDLYIPVISSRYYRLIFPTIKKRGRIPIVSGSSSFSISACKARP